MNGTARCRRRRRSISGVELADPQLVDDLEGGLGAHRFELRLEPLDLGVGRPAKREAPAHADAHGAQHREVRRRAIVGVASPPELARAHILERRLDEIGKLQVLEQDIEELGFAERERERILAAPGVRRLPARPAGGAALGFVDAVPGDELLVAGQHEFAPAAVAREMELRLADAVARDRDRAALAGVGDGAVGDRLVDRALDLRTGAAEEALAIAQALVARIEAAVDELGHGGFPLSRYPALLTRMYHSTSRRTWRSV